MPFRWNFGIEDERFVAIGCLSNALASKGLAGSRGPANRPCVHETNREG